MVIKKIEIVGTEDEDVIILGDITENDMIVVSTLNTGYEGMELTPMKLEKKRRNLNVQDDFMVGQENQKLQIY